MYDNSGSLVLERERATPPIYKHVAKTYAWMFLGLAITFLVGLLLATTGMIYVLLLMPLLPIILLVAELALVLVLSARLGKLSIGAARGIFIGYSALSGVTFSAVLLAYGVGQVFFFFGVTALFFGAMSVAGLITQQDVSRLRYLVLFGLIALLVMELIALFVGATAFEQGLCFVGIAVFMGITTYDSKRMKDLFYAFEEQPAMLEKASIFCALQLYLDFLNLFLYLVRLLGRDN